MKLWYLAPMFRYEAPQAGRYREHWQIGVEAIGSDDPLLDAEVIALLDGVYRRLGRAGRERCASGSMGDPESRGPATGALLVDYLEAPRRRARRGRAGAPAGQPAAPVRHQGPARARRSWRGAPTLLDHLVAGGAGPPRAGARRARRGSASRTSRTRPWCAGFDYYTMTVFEFTCDRLGAQSGIGGGGRYDGLVEQLGGPPTPGIGFGAGIERIVLALEAAEVADGEPGARLLPRGARRRPAPATACRCSSGCGRRGCAARATCAGAA